VINAALLVTIGAVFCHLPVCLANAEDSATRVCISAVTELHDSAPAESALFLARKSSEQTLRLIMVIIRARSSAEVEQLRRMNLDIAKVRPDSDRPPEGEMTSGGFIVEAVVSAGMLKKLKAKGFQVTEIP
jgi:hypothetical protein